MVTWVIRAQKATKMIFPLQDGKKMPQRVADYFVVAGLDFNNAKSLRLPGEAANQSEFFFIV